MTDPGLHRRLVLVVPLAGLVFAATVGVIALLASSSVDVPGSTTEAWDTLLSDDSYMDRLAFSVAQAAVAVAIGLGLGVPASWFLGLRGIPIRPLLTVLLIAPLAVPGVALALGVRALEFDALRPEALIIGAHSLFAVAAVVWLLTPAWRTPSAHLTEAARLLGAGHWRAYRAGSGEQLPRAARRAAALAFVYAFASVAPVVLLGGAEHATTEAHLAFFAVASAPLTDLGDRALVAQQSAAALVQVAVVGMVLLAGGVRWPRASVIARPASGWAIVPGTLYLLALAATVAAPLVALGREAVAVESFNAVLDAEVGGDGVRSLLGWTALYAALAGLGATLLAWPASHALSSSTATGSARLLVAAVALPAALAGAALGWGGGVLADLAGVDLDRTYALTIAAHVLLAYPFALRILGAPRGRGGRQAMEAALLLGQSPRAAAWRVRGRRTAQALLGAALVSAVLSAGEVAAANLLTPGEARPAALGLLRAAASPPPEAGAIYAVAALLSLMTVVAFACAEWLRRRAGRAEAI